MTIGWQKFQVFRGRISQGKTREEAVANIKEAIDAYINALTEDGLSIPEERFELWWLYEQIACNLRP